MGKHGTDLDSPGRWLWRINLWPRLVVGLALEFLALLVVVGLLILCIVEDSRDRILDERASDRRNGG